MSRMRQRAVWPLLELLLAATIIAVGLTVPSPAFVLGSAPWLLVFGLALVWWRGPGWREAGLRAPVSWPRTIAVGVAVGIGWQVLGTYVVEPVIARLTSGARPDVSQFRTLIGNETQLVFWLTITWTLAAVVEELAYRGWILSRCAEVGRFSKNAWLGGVFVSSLLFGIVHAYQGLSGMVATGLTGVVFGGTYLATGRNLWAAMIAHGVLDTVGFLMMYANVYPGL
jgi:membrane protease YdiL (CAAX protease family)